MKRQQVLVGLVIVGLLTPRPPAWVQDAARQSETVRLPGVLSPLGVPDAQSSLPLYFEPNLGQSDPRVRFLARMQRFRLFLTPTEAVLVFTPPSGPQEVESRDAGPLSLHGACAVPGSSATIRMTLVGSRPNPGLIGQTRLPGKVNYFIGNDPTKWRTNIPTYARVHYQAVYPGIDLVYHGTARDLEYDFIVASGADPDIIALRFEGVDEIELDARGDLVLHGVGWQIRHRKPVVYQEVAGVRRQIVGGYVLNTKDRVGFWVGSYDRSRPLVIDPVLSYSTYVGGSSNDLGYSIAVDASGHAYVTGQTGSPIFPTTGGVLDATTDGNDAFVIKLDPTGSSLVYATVLGGSAAEFGTSIVVDASGNTYVTGFTQSTNFPITPGALDTTPNGQQEAFVTKLNPSGSALSYSTFLGGSSHESGNGIAVDSVGNVYVAGFTFSTNFPTTRGAYDTSANGDADAFVAKLNPSGSAFVYSTYIGGRSRDLPSGVAADASGNAYVAGLTMSADFPTTPGAVDTTYNGLGEIFVATLSPAGSALRYSTYLGGSSVDQPNAIAVDAAGSTFVTGITFSTDFPTTAGVFDATANGADDAFVAKLNPSGSTLTYSTYLGGEIDDRGRGIAIDAAGNAYVTGNTRSRDFPTVEALRQGAVGDFDVFVAMVNPAGSGLVFSTYLGGSAADQANDIAVDAAGNIYVTGVTRSADFPTTSGALDTAANGGSDAFVVKISIVGGRSVAPRRVD